MINPDVAETGVTDGNEDPGCEVETPGIDIPVNKLVETEKSVVSRAPSWEKCAVWKSLDRCEPSPCAAKRASFGIGF